MSAALKALMAIGTDCRLSERRCAVTGISSSEGAAAGLVSAASTGAVAQITQAEVQKKAKPVAPTAFRCVESLFLIAPPLEFFVRPRDYGRCCCSRHPQFCGCVRGQARMRGTGERAI